MSKSEVKLFLQIEKQGYRYDVSATYKKEKCSKPQKFERTLYLDMLGSSDNLKVKEYRCYGHTLNSYFQNNIKSINEGNFQDRSDPGINFRSDVDDLKDVDVKLKVSICKVKINIYDKNDTILSNLTYTSEEYLQNRNLYVYFYNPNDRETDTLPLLFQYKDAFYAPESRENYFKKWKEVTELNKIVNKQVNVYLTNESQESIREKELKAERIRNKLDKIFKMLNEVNLLKRSDYGIPYCSKEFLNTKYFNTKRFEVKVSKNNTYQKVTHTSVNKYLIGSIKGVENCNFDDHVDKMIKKDVVNEVVAYFHGNEKRPELILLNEKVGYGWSKFTGGSQFYDEESPVIDILKKMKNENMIDDHPQRQIDTYTEECQNEYEEDVEDGQCPTPKQMIINMLIKVQRIMGLYSDKIKGETGYRPRYYIHKQNIVHLMVKKRFLLGQIFRVGIKIVYGIMMKDQDKKVKLRKRLFLYRKFLALGKERKQLTT
ncbi:hypothetical protein MACJ_000424 [Theileria orientalis]|uniref:Uncharacterized protein n=1 Tax=Theileria orientalis TaxID=68886 RepID=A0A976M403_THEOR|nr:hypothetical protein MACJ_000424 [Theileria orientalis]